MSHRSCGDNTSFTNSILNSQTIMSGSLRWHLYAPSILAGAHCTILFEGCSVILLCVIDKCTGRKIIRLFPISRYLQMDLCSDLEITTTHITTHITAHVAASVVHTLHVVDNNCEEESVSLSEKGTSAQLFLT